jgi:hypothetical protein
MNANLKVLIVPRCGLVLFGKIRVNLLEQKNKYNGNKENEAE